MNNSLIKMRVINQEVKMKRDEIREYETQSKLLYANLTRLTSVEYVKNNHSDLYYSVNYVYK